MRPSFAFVGWIIDNVRKTLIVPIDDNANFCSEAINRIYWFRSLLAFCDSFLFGAKIKGSELLNFDFGLF